MSRYRSLAVFNLVLAGALVACTGDPGATGEAGQPGGPGPDGANALVKTSDEAPGANCANGGTKIEVGVDADGDGALDTTEVTSTSYVCDGETGTGQNSLVTTTAEPGGANCPYGGTKIETGLDANADGVLDAGEVNASATSYVCNVAPSGAISPSTGINVEVKSTSSTSPVTVRFTLKDDRGFPLDLAGAYSTNLALQPRFSLAYFTKDATTGTVSPLVVYTRSGSTQAPTAYSPKTSTVQGTLVENGYAAGDYTYSFPTSGTPTGSAAIALDSTQLNQTHVVWIQVSRQTDEVFPTNANTYTTANESYYFVPDGSTAPSTREIANQDGCDSCHAKFKVETTTANAFHSGGRIDVGYCNVCHNPGRTSNLLADSASFIHRIHNGEDVATANLFRGIAATYPQSIQNCATCHAGAAQGGQATNNPKTISCKGCHDNVSFADTEAISCNAGGVIARGTDGKPLPCNHAGGVKTDATCASCHADGGLFPTASYHKPVVGPDPNSTWSGGTNGNTHASYVAAVGYVPTGAEAVTYDVKTVQTVADTVDATIKRPQIIFKLKKGGMDVVFQTYAAGVTTELIPNFVGSPSAYFAFAVPQDGATAPSDFNASASGYIKKIWDGTATGTGAGTMTGPDATGYYTLTLTGVRIPATAKMLTGGLGYTYSLSSAPPLVQTNLAEYPYNTTTRVGGLSVPAPNVWKVATGFTGRRAIVDNDKCKDCHGALGVDPSFHAGQRNDGPTCSFCHTPNRTSAGWSAGSKYFIHAVHAGRKRTVPFTWRATAVGAGYAEIEFPGTLNTCTTCHVSNTFDFTNPTNLAAVANMELTTVAQGTYNTDPLVNSSYYTVSPYVTADGVTSYGSGFSFNAGTGVTTEAAGTTLVLSPITGACSSCHDSTIALSHMKANGGVFYGARSTVLANPGAEQCLICHGPGRSAAIGEVHQR